MMEPAIEAVGLQNESWHHQNEWQHSQYEWVAGSF